MRRLLYACVAVVSVVVTMVTVVSPAQAVQVTQNQLVSTKPVNWTPAVNDGAVRAVIQVGNTIVLGGTFTSVTPAGSTIAQTHNNIVAFSATDGTILSTFNPTIDGPVDALVAAPDGQSVYVGGEFSTVNGVATKSLTRLSMTNGATVTTFKTVAINGNVLDLKLSGSRLWVGGNFTKFATFSQPALATVNATTGKYDPFDQVQFAGVQHGGTTAIQKFDITPDGSRLLVIGNFTSVGGVTHHQAAMLDIGGTSAVVSDWATSFYDGNCASAFQSYMRDLDISPDGQYAVVSTTGAYGGSTSPCDETSRWEMTAHGTGLTPTWTDYTGGDTTYAVAITGVAVYVGGHFRWENNAFAGDRAGAGAVAREGIAALDPKNGLPLGWDPGRTRGVGVFDMLATPAGLWVGSDTDRLNGALRPRIAFLPLNTGTPVPSTATPTLPGQVYLGGNTAGTNSNVLYRVNAAGPTLPSLDSGPDWSADNGTTNPLRTTGSNVATYAPSATLKSNVPASTPAALFDSERWDPAGGTDLQWSFPVPVGTHVDVRLYFANRCTCTASVGQRKFNVAIDNTTVLPNFDIVADAGGTNIGEMRTFPITSDGTVNINFSHLVENPLIDGIEIINDDTVLTGSPNDLVTRTFDGTTSGATSTVPNTGISWSQARGAFYIGGTLYTGWTDGNLYARPFDGTTFGTPVSVNGMDQISVLSAFHTDVQSMTSMFFDSTQNRIYYTLTGTNQLYWRAFTPSTNVVGAVRFNATNNTTVNFANATAMLLNGSNLYVGDRTTGNLVKVAFAGGVVSGTPTTISGPAIDNTSWLGRAIFLTPVPGAPNQPPTAAFTSDCSQGSTCTFDATGSTDPDGTIQSYTWDFGDGTSAASAQPEHVYGAGGSYNVTLTVTDNLGESAKVTHVVTPTSTNQPPVAAFTSSCTALSCTFDGSGSSDADGTVDAYQWDFGDGTTSQEVSPTHTFGSAGSYSVSLEVIDDQNATDTLTQQVTVGATAANIGFVGSATASANLKTISVTVPAAVTADDALVLAATSANATTPLTAPAGWTTVDSTTASGIQTQIWQQVATAGSAGSTVTVNLGTAAKTTLVLAAYSGTNTTQPVQQDAITSETVSRTGHTTPTLTTSLSGAWVLSYVSDVSASTSAWTPPAGQTARATAFGSSTGHVSTLLADPGSPLTVGSVGGYTATANSASAKATMATLVLAPEGVTAPNQPPTAAFTSSCSALSCTFDGTGSTDPDGTIASYAWTFGDGGTATGSTPNHTFATPGIYSVALTVTDDQNATNTSTQQVSVKNTTSNVAFVGSASGVANAKKVSATVPSGVASGNGMVLIATSANPTTVLAAPAGWTLVDSKATTQMQTQVWQQVATAASAGSVVSVTQADIAKVTLTLAAYSGTAATTPFAADAMSAETATTATHTTPTLSTALSGAWLVSYWADVSTDTSSWATQAGQVSRQTAFGTGGGHVSSVLSDLGGPLTVGTVGGYTATSNAASAKAIMVTLVLASS